MKVKCICINDKAKPSVIPYSKWIKEGEIYHITHIFIQKLQGNIQGCEIAERDISEYKPYNCFRLDRFAFNPEDIPKLIELIKHCSQLNNVSVNIEELTKTLIKNE